MNGTVTIINTTPYKLQPVPEVGKEYNAFDDGKIRPSRLEVVKIVELIPFDKADEELINEWKQNVEECYWLYAPETDYFAKGEWDDETSYQKEIEELNDTQDKLYARIAELNEDVKSLNDKIFEMGQEHLREIDNIHKSYNDRIMEIMQRNQNEMIYRLLVLQLM